MIDPKPEDVQRRALYTPPGPHVHTDREVGSVTSWSDLYVFVRFAPGCAAKACRRVDLEWENELEGVQNYLDKDVGAYVLREKGVDVDWTSVAKRRSADAQD